MISTHCPVSSASSEPVQALCPVDISELPLNSNHQAEKSKEKDTTKHLSLIWNSRYSSSWMVKMAGVNKKTRQRTNLAFYNTFFYNPLKATISQQNLCKYF